MAIFKTIKTGSAIKREKKWFTEWNTIPIKQWFSEVSKPQPCREGWFPHRACVGLLNSLWGWGLRVNTPNISLPEVDALDGNLTQKT